MGHEGSNTTAREHKVSGSKSISVQTQGNKVALRRLAQTQHDRKGEASCLGTTEVLLVNGELDVLEGIGELRVAVVGTGDLLLLDSKAPTSTAAADQQKRKSNNKARVSI